MHLAAIHDHKKAAPNLKQVSQENTLSWSRLQTNQRPLQILFLEILRV